MCRRFRSIAMRVLLIDRHKDFQCRRRRSEKAMSTWRSLPNKPSYVTEFNYGMEFLFLISVIKSARGEAVDHALGSLANLTLEFGSLIVQATQDGTFAKSERAELVSSNKLPLVTIFSRETALLIFENPIKYQILLFVTSNGSEKVIPTFQEAAKLFNGKIIFVYLELDDEEVGKPVSEYFGITGDGPKVLPYTATGNEKPKKYLLDSEVTIDNIKSSGEGLLEDKLKPFLKSDPKLETVELLTLSHHFYKSSVCLDGVDVQVMKSLLGGKGSMSINSTLYWFRF